MSASIMRLYYYDQVMSEVSGPEEMKYGSKVNYFLYSLSFKFKFVNEMIFELRVKFNNAISLLVIFLFDLHTKRVEKHKIKFIY